MIQGFNTDMKVNGTHYHVQTELVGDRIVTLIFEEGAVIGGRKTEILSGKIYENGTLSDDMKAKMRKQHMEIVNEIKSRKKPSEEDRGEIKDEGEDKDLIKNFLENWAKK